MPETTPATARECTCECIYHWIDCPANAATLQRRLDAAVRAERERWLSHLLTIGHQETPCVFGGFVCLLCHEQDVTLTDPLALKHDEDCMVAAALRAPEASVTVPSNAKEEG